MTINEMFAINLSRARRWHPGGIEEWSALEWAGAMAGEAGETANAAKKLKRIETGMANIDTSQPENSDDFQKAQWKVLKEAADTIIYGLLVMARAGATDPEAVLASVFNRKSEEYGFPERL